MNFTCVVRSRTGTEDPEHTPLEITKEEILEYYKDWPGVLGRPFLEVGARLVLDKPEICLVQTRHFVNIQLPTRCGGGLSWNTPRRPPFVEAM